MPQFTTSNSYILNGLTLEMTLTEKQEKRKSLSLNFNTNELKIKREDSSDNLFNTESNLHINEKL